MALLDEGSNRGRARQTERIFLVVVDASAEMPVALRYASLRARATGGRVALFTAVEKEGFGHWAAVDDLLEAEQREEAEALLSRYAEVAQAVTGQAPVLYIRHGFDAGRPFEADRRRALDLHSGAGGRHRRPQSRAADFCPDRQAAQPVEHSGHDRTRQSHRRRSGGAFPGRLVIPPGSLRRRSSESGLRPIRQAGRAGANRRIGSIGAAGGWPVCSPDRRCRKNPCRHSLR